MKDGFYYIMTIFKPLFLYILAKQICSTHPFGRDIVVGDPRHIIQKLLNHVKTKN